MSGNKQDNYQNRIPVVDKTYFKSLVETLPLFISFVDPINYRITYVNKVQEGYTVEGVVGKEIFDFIPAEHITLYKQKMEDVKSTGNPATIEIPFTSYRLSGGKAWYRSNISIVNGSKNSVESLVIMSEDITNGKLLEFENINKSEKLKAIINNTSDIICSIDCDYNLMEFNSVFAKMVKKGFDAELGPGMSILQFIDPTKHEHLKAIYKRVQNGETYNDTEGFRTITGDFVYMETSFNPIFNADKKISGISIFSKNITERVKSEQKINNSLKEKEILLVEIHHRIKNNLAMVSSLLELQEINITNAEAIEAIRVSRKRIKSTALIHELLYRSESFQSINLIDYLTELFDHLKLNENIKLKLKGDEVKLDLTTAMPLGLMLNEIMINSFKHSFNENSKGEIEIITTSGGNTLTINYYDFEGNFPETIDFRNSNSTGLALIHTFTEQLNGSIELVRKAPIEYKIQIPLNEN